MILGPFLYLATEPNTPSGEICLRFGEIAFAFYKLVHALTRHFQDLRDFGNADKFVRHARTLALRLTIDKTMM